MMNKRGGRFLLSLGVAKGTGLILFFFLPLLLLPSTSYSSRFTQYGVAQGLSFPVVRALLQDRVGYIWAATDLGLNRFDGQRFQLFHNNPGEKDCLSSSLITALVMDNEGTLWVGTQDGLNRFDPDHLLFKQYHHSGNDDQALISDGITALACDEQGRIWLATQAGVSIVNSAKECLTPVSFSVPGHDTSKRIYCTSLHIMGETMWVGSLQGLYRCSLTDPHLEYVPGQERGQINQQITALSQDEAGRLWLGTLDGLYRVDIQAGGAIGSVRHFSKKQEDEHSLASDHISSVFSDRDGKGLWVGTNMGGFHYYDENSEQFTRFQFKGEGGGHISVDDIRCIFQDSKKILWVGTNVGLSKFIPMKRGFHHHFRIPDQPSAEALFHNVHSFCQDQQGGIWLGGRGMGIYRLADENRAAVRLTNDPLDSNSINSNEVRDVFVDHKGILWCGTYGSGLNRIQFEDNDFSRMSVQHFTLKQGNLIGDVVNDLFVDSVGEIWVGTRSGLGVADQAGRQFVHAGHRIDGLHHLDNTNIYTIVEDSRQNLWIGTIGDGAYRLTRKGDTDRFDLRHYRVSESPGQGLSSNQVLSIHEDSGGAIWMGTMTGGLSRIEPESGHVSYITERNGLSSNMVYGILEDENNDFWLSTSRGICLYKRKSGEFISYTEEDGLPTDDYNGGAFYKSRKGEMFFGGGIGFISFFPGEIKESASEPPPVVIAELLIMNKVVPIGAMADGRMLLDRAVDRARVIRLKRSDRLLTISYSALGYTNPDKNQYSYMMKGLDKVWIDAGNRRAVTYTYIPPGSYTFMVKSSSDDGNWGVGFTSLKVVMVPEYWETLWFKLLVISLLMGMVYLFFRLRMWGLNKRKDELERTVDERTLALKRANDKLSAVNAELEMLSTAVSQSDNAIAIHTAQGDLEWVNQGFVRLYGWSKEELIAHLGPNLRDQSFSPLIEDHINDCILKKQSVVYEVLNETKNRGKVWTQTTITPILNQQGEVEKLVTVDTEITKIKDAEAKAEGANRAKSEFLASMSHEIRTPLNGILGFAELLGDFVLSEVQHEYLENIQKSGSILLDLINDILDLSKIEAGEMNLEELDFDPEVLCFDVCDLMTPKIIGKPLEILCDVGYAVPALVKGDAVRYRQVLINLMGNAVKFTAAGEVVLAVKLLEKKNGRICLLTTVTDSGAGVAPEKSEMIFDPFRQADGSTARNYGGSGLGLSISRRIARLMNGDVFCAPRSDGRPGSVFGFKAWLGQVENAPPRTALADKISLVNKKILVVDDNPRNLDIVKGHLESLSCRVVLSGDSRQTMSVIKMAELQGELFDLVILDIDMPYVTGTELAQAIRSLDGPHSGVPLLAFSSTSQRGLGFFKAHGFDGYLTKPVKRNRLSAMVERALGFGQEPRVESDRPFLISESITEERKQTVHILMVEDNPINQKLARFMLDRAGYQATIVDNGLKALEILESDVTRYDIIFMDIQMPGIDGCETTRLLRARGIQIPVVAMTASSMPDDRGRCMASGMNEYLTKPIKRADIYETIRRFFPSMP